MPTVSFPNDPELKRLISLLAIKRGQSQAQLTREAYEIAFGDEIESIRSEVSESFFVKGGSSKNRLEGKAS